MHKPIKPPVTARTLSIANTLFSDAQALERDSLSALDTATISQLHDGVLSEYVIAKQGQAEALEDRLESLVLAQTAKFQQLQNAKPGLLAKPSARNAWNAALATSSARLETLNSRLQGVKEIKDHMGLHSSKIEELARSKMKFETPALVEAWQDAKAGERLSGLEAILSKKSATVRSGAKLVQQSKEA